MTAPRKKWSTTFRGWRQSHRSKVATYRYVQDVAAESRGDEPARELKVWVDDGHGWELYETLNLDELAATR